MALPVFVSSRKSFFEARVANPMKHLAGAAALLFLVACEPEATSDADWGRHDAYQFCNAAIRHYPEKPAPPCEAMDMCANEGALSDAERAKLYDMIAKTKGCATP